ncbi:MAG: hypothetical protein ACAH83_15890 [Alphaproteobacteria bacterium]
MLEALKKSGRAFRRDYFTGSALMICGVVAVLTVLSLLTGTPAVAALVAGAVLTGGTAASFAAWQERQMRKTKDIDLGYVKQGGLSIGEAPLMAFWHLQGPGKNISVVNNTQKLIDAVTAKYRNDAQLPAPVVARLQPYLKDAEEAARDVKLVMPSDKPVEAPVFEFFRTVFKAAGQKEQQFIAAVPLPSYTPPPWEAVRLAREAEARRLDMIEQMAADMLKGTDKTVVLRTLRLKPKAGLSR